MNDLRRILVTTYCQTPGLASALRLIFPDAEIFTRSSLAKQDANPADVAHLLGQIDAWVNIEAGPEFFSGAEFAQSHPQLRYVSVPLLEFAAFHPDVCTAAQTSSNKSLTAKHTSAIAVWAYRNKMPVRDAVRLFNRASFANLGYLSNWEQSAARLRTVFAASSLAEYFDRFYLRVKRLGVFMYSNTHPRPEALAELAKIVALKLGKSDAALNIDLPTLDALSYFLWPVYPEIAGNLSVRTSGYVWQLADGTRIEGLENFLKHSYNYFHAQGLAPADIGIAGVDMDRLGQAVVLGA
jgi:hypothetical protein